MSIIPPDVQLRLTKLFGTGLYASEEEVLRAAIAALEERDTDLAAIQAGIDDRENGRCRPFAEFVTQFRTENQIENDE